MNVLTVLTLAKHNGQNKTRTRPTTVAMLDAMFFMPVCRMPSKLRTSGFALEDMLDNFQNGVRIALSSIAEFPAEIHEFIDGNLRNILQFDQHNVQLTCVLIL